MEQEPKKFPRNVSKIPEGLLLPNWEDGGSDIIDMSFLVTEDVLKKQGVDIKKSKVLELGSGNAALLDYMRQKGVNATGVDVRPRGSNESPQVLARIEQLPFPDESFDVVLSAQIFDSALYKQDSNLMFKEISRVLKHHGIYLGRSEEPIHRIPNDLVTLTNNSQYQSDIILYKRV